MKPFWSIDPHQAGQDRRVQNNTNAAVWPEVAKTISECNITNYSIYHHDGLLFAYFEYVGDDFEGDMAKMAADPMTQKWWAVQKPLQQPYEKRKEDEWWADMEEVFHQD